MGLLSHYNQKIATRKNRHIRKTLKEIHYVVLLSMLLVLAI